jgi:hypothetical protein
LIVDADRRRCEWHCLAVALGLIAKLDPTSRALARGALDAPNPATLQALLDAGRTAEWRPMLLEALASAAVGAADDIYGDGDE